MNYRVLGKTGVRVSSLCFGTMSFGGDADEATAAAMFHRCREAGINLFDCADVYQQGRSEEILGKLIAECRDEVVLASKVYFPTGKDINASGATRYHLVRALDGSLQRLHTDYIDLYFVHRFDDTTPLEETLRALDDQVRSGKVLYIGASNFAAWQVAKALGLSALHDWMRFECIQPMYNLVKRQAEVELLPMAESENVGVISYSPLGGGLLSGKYGKNRRPKAGRLVGNKIYETRYGEPWMFEAADNLSALAVELGHHPASLAVAWVMSHPAITAPIIGARSLEQLAPSLQALEVKMTAELRNRISALSPEPPLATDRNEERTEHSFAVR